MAGLLATLFVLVLLTGELTGLFRVIIYWMNHIQSS